MAFRYQEGTMLRMWELRAICLWVASHVHMRCDAEHVCKQLDVCKTDLSEIPRQLHHASGWAVICGVRAACWIAFVFFVIVHPSRKSVAILKF